MTLSGHGQRRTVGHGGGHAPQPRLDEEEGDVADVAGGDEGRSSERGTAWAWHAKKFELWQKAGPFASDTMARQPRVLQERKTCGLRIHRSCLRTDQ